MHLEHIPIAMSRSQDIPTLDHPATRQRSVPPGADRATLRRYRKALNAVVKSEVPFLVGGGYALECYTGLGRPARDFDLFVRRRDIRALLDALAAEGLRTDMVFPHWLAKVYIDGDCIDLIFSSGNAVAEVDDEWFRHSLPNTMLGHSVRLCPPEEMIWSKAFIMERERYDGADIAHLIRACGERLDWRRLLDRFGPDWRVLLSHLTLFGYIYPADRHVVPSWLIPALTQRLESELRQPTLPKRICRGTLLSRQQFLTDVRRWGYIDGRLQPHGRMMPEDVARWTAPVADEDADSADCRSR
jgi:hypothetical protein